MARTPNYVVGRGKLFFDQFLTGTKTFSGNERYLGNSPELSMSQDEETLDHYGSDSGIKVKDATVELQNDQSGSFQLDDISKENLAMWFRGAAQSNSVAALVDATTNVPETNLGQYVQLGLSAGDPIGARVVSGVTCVNNTDADSAVLASGNFEVDAATGRVFILENAADIAQGDELTFTFDAALHTEEVVVAGNTIIEGRMVFISDNAAGENRDYFWPYVRVRPDGDFSLKGDEWQNMTFSVEVLKLNDSTQRQYIIKR